MRLRVTAATVMLLGLAATTRAQTSLSASVYASGFSSPIAFVQDPADHTTQFVVRLANSGWYVLRSSSGYSYATYTTHFWGLSGDIPILKRP